MLLTCNAGLGLELGNLLREQLGIPANVLKFSVHFAQDGIVTVDCTYYPEGPAEPDPDATVRRDPVAEHNARKLSG